MPVTERLTEDLLLQSLEFHTATYPGTETLDCLMEALSRDPDSGINYVSIVDGLAGTQRSPEELHWEVAVASKKMGDAKERISQRLGQHQLPQLQWELTRYLTECAADGPSPSSVSLKSALVALAAAAETFNRSVTALEEERFTSEHLQSLGRAAIDLSDVVDTRTDLALRAHQIRARASASLPPHALHAASATYIATMIASAIEVHPHAKRAIAQIALFAHLPPALSANPPSPDPVEPEEASRMCAAVAEKISASEDEAPDSGATTPWLSCGWQVARAYRLHASHQLTEPSPMSLSRLVRVSSAYDAMLTSQNPPLSPQAAIIELAKRPLSGGFDTAYITILAAVLAAYK